MTIGFALCKGGSLQHRLIEASLRAPDGVEPHIVPPPCTRTVAPADFSHSDELIKRADTATEDAQSPTLRRAR